MMTREEFIEKISVVYPDFNFNIEVDEVFNNTMVEIICPKHGTFYRSVHNCLIGNVRCPGCYYENRKRNFLEVAHNIHGDYYDYSKGVYIADKKPFEIICPEHGSFWQAPNDHKKGYGCSKCSKKHKPTTEEWVNSVKELYAGKYDLSKVVYKDNKTPVVIICPKHGEFYPIPNNYKKGVSGCPKCNDLRKHEQFCKTTEQFILDAILVHGNKYSYDKVDYYNKTRSVIITCPIHGDFEQIPAVHLIGCGCPKCKNKSQTDFYNKIVSEFSEEKISYEKRLEWLGLMSFDIYFDDYNIAIEFDGIQHYEPVEYFGGLDYFNIIQERDSRKNQLCVNNNCFLIRVPYNYTDSDFNEIVSKIKNKIIDIKRAYKTQSDADYKALGRYIFKEMKAQDNRPAEYTE